MDTTLELAKPGIRLRSDVRHRARGIVSGTAQFLMLLVLGILVLFVLSYDVGMYHGVDWNGRPIYPEDPRGQSLQPCSSHGDAGARGDPHGVAVSADASTGLPAMESEARQVSAGDAHFEDGAGCLAAYGG